MGGSSASPRTELLPAVRSRAFARLRAAASVALSIAKIGAAQHQRHSFSATSLLARPGLPTAFPVSVGRALGRTLTHPGVGTAAVFVAVAFASTGGRHGASGALALPQAASSADVAVEIAAHSTPRAEIAAPARVLFATGVPTDERSVARDVGIRRGTFHTPPCVAGPQAVLAVAYTIDELRKPTTGRRTVRADVLLTV